MSTCTSSFLGWAFSESGDKAPPFGAMFQALGVTIDVSTLHNGLVKLGNTESRRKELVEFLDLVIARGHMTKQEALRLRGLLQFTSGNVFGRIAKCSLTAVSDHAYSSCGTSLSDDAILALKLHRCLLSAAVPGSSSHRQLNHGSFKLMRVMMLMETVLQRELVQCSLILLASQCTIFRAGGQMRWYPYSTHPANGLRFSNVNSSLCFALSCFGEIMLQMRL